MGRKLCAIGRILCAMRVRSQSRSGSAYTCTQSCILFLHKLKMRRSNYPKRLNTQSTGSIVLSSYISHLGHTAPPVTNVLGACKISKWKCMVHWPTGVRSGRRHSSLCNFNVRPHTYIYLVIWIMRPTLLLQTRRSIYSQDITYPLTTLVQRRPASFFMHVMRVASFENRDSSYYRCNSTCQFWIHKACMCFITNAHPTHHIYIYIYHPS